MFKRTLKRTVFVAAIAVAVLLAGCDGDPDRLNTIPHEIAGDTEISGMVQPTLIELRHFAVYNNYRAMFDGSPPRALNSLRGLDNAIQEAGSAPGSKSTGGVLSTCSVRALLTQDW